jgi:hypothetical protein
MQAPTLNSTYKDTADSTQRSSTADFFLTHPLLPVLRSLFFSVFLWVFLALGLYFVYTLIASH